MNTEDMRTLRRFDDFIELQDWAVGQSSWQEAWSGCRRGDWLLGIAERLDIQREDVVIAASACARTALVHIPDDRPEPEVVLALADLWAIGQGGVTCADVEEATRDCLTSFSSAANASFFAVRAASYVGCAVDRRRDGNACCAVSNAAMAFDAANLTGRAADARAASLKRSAVLVRRYIPWEMVACAIRDSRRPA